MQVSTRLSVLFLSSLWLLAVTNLTASIWATGRTWWQVPPVAQVKFTGALPQGVTGKEYVVSEFKIPFKPDLEPWHIFYASPPSGNCLPKIHYPTSKRSLLIPNIH